MGFSRKSGGRRGGQEQELVGSPEGVDTSGLSLGTPGRTGCSLMGSGLPGYHAGAEGEGSRDPGALDPPEYHTGAKGEGSGDPAGGTRPPWTAGQHPERPHTPFLPREQGCRKGLPSTERWAPCSPTSGPSRPSNVICLSSWDFIHRRCLKQESTCDMQG